MGERRIPIDRETSIYAERLLRQRELAELLAGEFLRGLAFGLGILPPTVITKIDTDRDEVVIVDVPQAEPAVPIEEGAAPGE
jgi:hypothetical protein